MPTTTHSTKQEASEAFREAFEAAQTADGYLAAVWTVRDGKLQLSRCTAHNFPDLDRALAEQQFSEVNAAFLAAECPPEPDPLPDAGEALRPIPEDVAEFGPPDDEEIPQSDSFREQLAAGQPGTDTELTE